MWDCRHLFPHSTTNANTWHVGKVKWNVRGICSKRWLLVMAGGQGNAAERLGIDLMPGHSAASALPVPQIDAFPEPSLPSSACLCLLRPPVSRPENLLRFAVCNSPISSVHFWYSCFVLEHSASLSRPFIENSPCSLRWIYWEIVCFLHCCISQYLYFAHWSFQDAFVPWRD